MSDSVKASILSQLSSVARDLTVFGNPLPEHRKAKATFWSYFMGNELPAPEAVDLALARRHCGDSRITNWWTYPGFEDWFCNSEEFKQRIEFLAHLALDNIEDILRDKQANSTAKINAVKLVMEIGNKLPGKQQQDKYADEKIAEMNKDQLEEFIRKNLRRLPATQGLTDTSNNDTLNTTPGKSADVG